jgi:hypothetical protein
MKCCKLKISSYLGMPINLIYVLSSEGHLLVLVNRLDIPQQHSLIPMLDSYHIVSIEQSLEKVLNGLLAQLINLVGSFAYLKIEVPISL